MKRILIAAALATSALAGAAQAQGLQPSGTRAGGYAQKGAPGQITPVQRTYLMGYVAREGYSPVAVEGQVVPGWNVPAGVQLRAFPDTVYGEVPAARNYVYFSTGRNVILVDPSTHQVVEILG